MAFLMARSIESFDMFSARAAMMAARRRGFMAGSGIPNLAATVISRASLLNSLDFAASCRPLRCMMFLNCECPAIVEVLIDCLNRASDEIAGDERMHAADRPG